MEKILIFLKIISLGPHFFILIFA